MRFCLTLFFLGLFACQEQKQGYTIKHDAASYVLSADSWNWQDLTPQEFDEIYIPTNGWGTRDDFLPSSHTATRRMDSLLEIIHKRILERHPEQLKNVPVPRARIYNNDSPDAFVTTVPVCYSIPVKLAKSSPVQSTGDETEWITLDHNGNISGESHDGLCINRSMNVQETENYFGWINRNIRRAGSKLGKTDKFCEFKVEKTHTGFAVIPGPDCQRTPELTGLSKAEGFVIWKTQPYLVLNKGLLRHVDSEMKIITTLAHELGHYYRSHLTSFDGDYDYFYQLDPRRNPSHKPQPELKLQERGRDILAAALLVQAEIHEEPGQRYSSELFYPIWSLASRACPASSLEPCPKACQGFITFLNDDDTYASFGDWPYDSMPEAGHSPYQNYEQGLLACASQLKLTDHQTGGSGISLQDLEKSFQQENFSPTLKAMGMTNLLELKGLTLEQLIDRLELGLEKAKARSHEIIAQANADGIGYYTWEQEADEQQMETVNLLGLDPAQLVAWDVDFYKKMGGDHDENLGLNMERCDELLKKNWMEDGKPVLVAVADYYDRHHSDCFRIFITSRENASHQWHPQNIQIPIQFLSDAEWQSLQISLSNTVEKAIDGHQTSPLQELGPFLDDCSSEGSTFFSRITYPRQLKL